MLRVADHALNKQLSQGLAKYQAKVDAAGTYEMRVQAAIDEWDSKASNKTVFAKLRAILAGLCPGSQRCMYCEDSFADEIDHVVPKSFYPERVFDWLNYTYSCGPCNGPKSNRAGVIPVNSQSVNELLRARNAPVIPPPVGQTAFINPRDEDPLEFLELDLPNTFHFVPESNAGPVEMARAKFVIDVLRLNIRETLVQSRKVAYTTYRSLLKDYCEEKTQKNEIPKTLKEIEDSVRKSAHRTVWREMVRQSPWIPELASLFEIAPEARSW